MDDIKTIVQEVIRELMKEGLLVRSEDVAYRDISTSLYRYFDRWNPSQDESIRIALESVRTDMYFEIIPMYYQEGLTIEQIAEHLNVDTSTVVRNKKRLCLEVYRRL